MMKIRVYEFEWLDLETNCEYRQILVGKRGEEWKKDFDDDNGARCRVNKLKVTEIAPEQGMKFETDDYEITIDRVFENGEFSFTSVPKEGFGIFMRIVNAEVFEDYLNRLVEFGKSGKLEVMYERNECN